ncbi:ABC transporter substrate-binding protein [Methanocrinis sp.]|uniref:ABC transporter substrate-binding protein n=1 Tax=Methanocrinis sp. TaxID=3101522 RepID=UPI003D0E2C47
MRRDFLIAALAVGLAVLVALGCIGTEEEKITTLRIGYQPSTHQIAEMVAMEEGWWLSDLSPFGIEEVKDFEFPSGPPEMQAMLGGNLDIAYVGAAPPISAIAQGLEAKIVAAVQKNGSDLVVSPGVVYEGPESLVGLKVATFPPGSIQDTVFKKWLQDNGVDPAEIDIKSMGPGDATTAISARRVDAVFLPHPSPSIIELEGKGRSVVASGEMWPDHACCCLVVSDELLREEPELVEQIVRTHIRATEYINENPERAAEIYSAKTGQNLTMVQHSIENWDGAWISDPHEIIPSVVEYARVDYELGYTGDELLTEEDLFETSFYDRVVS